MTPEARARAEVALHNAEVHRRYELIPVPDRIRLRSVLISSGRPFGAEGPQQHDLVRAWEEQST